MGNSFNRSSSVRPEGTKTRWRNGKQKRLQTMETLDEDNTFVVQNGNEANNSISNYDEWNQRIDQQQIANNNGTVFIDKQQKILS